MNIKIWSNVLYVLPLSLAVFYNLYLEAFFIILSTIASILYHLSREKNHKLFVIDNVCSLLLIGSNLYLCYLSDFKGPYFQLAMIFVLIAFYYYFKAQKNNYPLHHSMWHIACAIITTFSVLSITIN